MKLIQFEKLAFDNYGHRWDGWPGANCMYCGQEDPIELVECAGVPLQEVLNDGLFRMCPGNKIKESVNEKDE